MLAVPDDTVHRTKVADWLELKALSSPDGRLGFATLVSATALSEEEQPEDSADEDIKDDALVLSAQAEIARRLKNIGEEYPFRIDDNGRAMRFITPVTKVGSVYLFCLFLSHAYDFTIMPKALAPKVTNKTRDLFQACATVAAGGYVQGPAMSFGFPRPDGETFLKALHRVYTLFGDGKPRKKPRAAAAKKIKDNGIDIIAWRRSIDTLPCTLYMIGQVASGSDWEGKSVVPDREHFHKYWFEDLPGSQPQDAMFMPFGLEPEDPEDGTAYDDVLKDYMQSVAYRYGTLFYRDRIAKHLADGLQLVADGEKEIERVSDLGEVVTWVKIYTEKLQAVV
ncbi:MAG TPA: hypothetical protein VH325_06445 [Bryobacteraceae bacterium]|nr:hypothetical protein [Bryobacteraceae bacterium]